MNSSQIDRILIAYATRAGSTLDVAAAIGESLSAKESHQAVVFNQGPS